MIAGWQLYKELFPNETKTHINSYMLRACCLIEEFTHHLSNGRLSRFDSYLRNVWSHKSIAGIVRGRATSQSPQFILDDLINNYNDWKGSENYAIGIKSRQNMAVINPRFLVPVT